MMNKEYVFVGTAQLKTRDYINQLEQENKNLKQKIDKAIGDIVTTIQIIGETPSRNIEEDTYILSKLGSLLETLGGDVDDE